MFQTEAQQATPEDQQLVLVKREVFKRIQSQENIMVLLLSGSVRRGVFCAYQAFVCSLTCGAAEGG